MAAVNRGEDADTVGAVTGQLVGALYGASAILERWIAPLPAQAFPKTAWARSGN